MFSPGVFFCVRFVCHIFCPGEGLVPRKQYFVGIHVGMTICALMCSTLMTPSMTSTCQKSTFEMTITQPVFVVRRGNKYSRNLWLTGLLPDTLSFRFGFRFERSSKVEKRKKILKFWHPYFYMRTTIWLQIWKLDGKLYKQNQFWSRWLIQWRHSATWNIAFQRRWLCEQVVRSISWVS